MRRTKIIATLGPALDNEKVLKSVLEAGVNLVRVNLSHSSGDAQRDRINLVKKCASELNKKIGFLLDLQGPKIRIAKFKDNKQIDLKEGQNFKLDVKHPENQGDEHVVGVDYKNLNKDVKPNDTLLLGDGQIVLTVDSVEGSQINCIVKIGGILSNNKGINRQGGGLSVEALTEKDKKDIKFIADVGADYVAVSFPRSAADMDYARKLLEEAGSKAKLIAKIERAEAVDVIDEISNASDALMVARGDLGIEIGFAELPGVQKLIIHSAKKYNKAVIVATQMMESMITSPIPTRAEVSDVANAVLDGTDAVMLSAESAVGAYPEKVVLAMSEICSAAEKQLKKMLSVPDINTIIKRIDRAVVTAAIYISNNMAVDAIVAFTETGNTALWMSRYTSSIPIYGVSSHKRAIGRMTLFKGVFPFEFDISKFSAWEFESESLKELEKQGILKKKQKIIVTRGNVTGVSGGANLLRIITI